MILCQFKVTVFLPTRDFYYHINFHVVFVSQKLYENKGLTQGELKKKVILPLHQRKSQT